MKKRIILLLALLAAFSVHLFAEDYVVTEIKGKANYQTSDGIFEKLNIGNKITSNTVINVQIDSYICIRNGNGKDYYISGITTNSVGENIEYINDLGNKNARRNDNDKLVEVAITPDHIDEIEFGFIKRSGFDSIKELPAGKNVVRLLALSWGHTVIELTWTESSASIAYVEEGSFSANELEWDDDFYKNGITERKINRKNVQKILDLMKKMDFYNQPGYVYHTAYSQRDGTIWYIEANIDGKYKSVRREEPRETFLKDLGEALIRLAR